MEPDSTSEFEKNINANVPDVDKYNTNLVQQLRKANEKLKRENAELVNENVFAEVKHNLKCRAKEQENLSLQRLTQDLALMTEENETLKRLVTAKQNRAALLEEEKGILVYEREAVVCALQQKVQLETMLRAQNEELRKQLSEAAVELSQCKIKMSGMENDRRLIEKLDQEKQQALMLVGMWQDKCKGLESLSDRLRIRLKVLAPADSDDDA